jgi:hypothetical protein
MGFFFADAQLGSTDGDRLAMTPREFRQFVARALGSVMGARDSDTYHPGAADRARRATLESLTARVRADPGDAAGHRMLAVAHLDAGNGQPGVHHLVTAADLLLRQCAAARTLSATLRAHLELKLVGILLVPVCLRHRMTLTVHRLLTEVLLVW